MKKQLRVGEIYRYRPDNGDLLLVISEEEWSYELFNMRTGVSKWRSEAWLESECEQVA